MSAEYEAKLRLAAAMVQRASYITDWSVDSFLLCLANPIHKFHQLALNQAMVNRCITYEIRKLLINPNVCGFSTPDSNDPYFNGLVAFYTETTTN